MTETVFQQFLIILSLSLLATLLFRRLAMTTIVAYLAVGALIGPYALGFVSDTGQFSFIAEFGVVFLLFSLGLEFSLQKMLALGRSVIGVGVIQVVLCTAVFAAAVYAWGSSVGAAVIIAGSLALSSTAIVTRELVNIRELHSAHGQLSVGVLLFQDLVAIVFLILVPVFADQAGVGLAARLLDAGISAVLLLAILLVIGRWVLPVIYTEVAKSNSDEIFLLTTVVIVLLAAWLTHSFHLSMPLGAFVIGMMLGEGPCRYQVESDIRPFKDILLGLFFVTIGMNLDLTLIPQFWLRLLVFTVALLLLKGCLIAFLAKQSGLGPRDALKVGINLCQAGEFGLALMALAMVNGILPAEQASFIAIIAILSMAASPLLIRRAGSISRRLLAADDREGSTRLAPISELQNHVIIGGFGRLGTMLGEFLEQNHIPYLALDADIEVVQKYRKLGKNIIYGNSNNIEILGRCHLQSARLIILTFKSLEEGRTAIARIRHRHPTIPIIVRCQDHQNFQELISLGANHVFPELLESSMLITRQVLGLLEVSELEVERQMGEFMRALVTAPRVPQRKD